jgi:hypothetical protein
MHRVLKTGLLHGLLLVSAGTFLIACGDSPPVQETASGEAIVGVSTQALSAADVTRVVITITGSGLPSPIVYPLQHSATTLRNQVRRFSMEPSKPRPAPPRAPRAASRSNRPPWTTQRR